MMVAKKSDACSATLTFSQTVDVNSMAAALATEDVDIEIHSSSLAVQVSADNISDLRARLNTTLRSIQAASESLIEVNRSR
jgi:tRNA threonylcarbamoyladenosine modification (KEOPS) complex  Pcc1 subunit